MSVNVSVENVVKDAIAATCQIDIAEVREDIALDDLGLGSMGLVAVITRLETECEIEFTPDQVIALLQSGAVGEFTSRIGEILRR